MSPPRRATWPNGEWGYSTRCHLLGPERTEAVLPDRLLTDLHSLLDCTCIELLSPSLLLLNFPLLPLPFSFLPFWGERKKGRERRMRGGERKIRKREQKREREMKRRGR